METGLRSQIIKWWREKVINNRYAGFRLLFSFIVFLPGCALKSSKDNWKKSDYLLQSIMGSIKTQDANHAVSNIDTSILHLSGTRIGFLSCFWSFWVNNPSWNLQVSCVSEASQTILLLYEIVIDKARDPVQRSWRCWRVFILNANYCTSARTNINSSADYRSSPKKRHSYFCLITLLWSNI